MPAGTNEFPIIFSGGVYVGENSSRLANVRAQRVRCGEPQPFQTDPSTKWGSFESEAQSKVLPL